MMISSFTRTKCNKPDVVSSTAIVQQKRIRILVVIFSNFEVEDGSGHTPIVFESHLFTCMLYSFRLPNFFWIAEMSSVIVFLLRSRRNNWMVYTHCYMICVDRYIFCCYNYWQRLICVFTFHLIDDSHTVKITENKLVILAENL